MKFRKIYLFALSFGSYKPSAERVEQVFLVFDLNILSVLSFICSHYLIEIKILSI